MKEQLQQRLSSLKAEFESGQKMLAELETKQANLRDTLLRISGAIQVLEEALADPEQNQATSELNTAEQSNGKETLATNSSAPGLEPTLER